MRASRRAERRARPKPAKGGKGFGFWGLRKINLILRGLENSNPLRYLTFRCWRQHRKLEPFALFDFSGPRKLEPFALFGSRGPENSNPLRYLTFRFGVGDEKVEPFTPERAQNEQKQYLDLFSHAKEGEGGKERKTISGASLGRLV